MVIVEEKLIEILDQINKIIDIIYDGEIESVGVLDGIAGIALFKMKYGHFLNDEKNVDKACEMLDMCIKKINEDYYYPSFCSGIAGFNWTMTYLHEKNYIDFEIDDTLLQLDTYLYKNMHRDFSNHNYDFLHGGLGYAIYFLDRYKNTKYDTIREQFKETILEVINILRIEVSLILEGINSTNNGVNLGLSHGITSILAFLNKVSKENLFKSDVDEIMMDLAFYIKGLKNVKNNTISFFPNAIEGQEDINYNSRLAWCYGDLGIAYVLLETAIILNLEDDSLKEEAIQILMHTVNRKNYEETLVEDPFLCHGSFGNAHMYDMLYYITNKECFKTSSIFWIDDGVRKFENLIKAGDLSLFKNKLGIIDGVAGIGLVIMSYLNRQNENWNKMFLLS